MRLIVPDASIAAKWFLPRANEPLVDEAFSLLQQYGHSQLDFIVPSVFWAELGNVFWKAARLGRWLPESAIAATRQIIDRDLRTIADGELLEDAIAIALTERRTIYDSLYVALATLYGAEMITGDERLANSLAARFPVKWLGMVV